MMTVLDDETPVVTAELRDQIRRRADRIRRTRRIRVGALIPALILTVVVGVVAWPRNRPGSEQITAGRTQPGRALPSGPIPTVGSGHWEHLAPGPLSTRTEGAAVWTGQDVIVVGGVRVDDRSVLDDGAAFDPSAGTWRMIPPVPGGGRIVAGGWSGNEAVFVGDHEADPQTNGSANVFVAFNPATNSWRALPAPQAAVGAFPAVVVVDNQIVVWGAPSKGGAPGAVYHPGTNTWSEIPPLPAGAIAGSQATPFTGGLMVPVLLSTPTRVVIGTLSRDFATWQLSPPSPQAVKPIDSITWDGQQAILTSEPDAPTQTYSPSTHGWGTAPSATAGVRVGTDAATPIKLSDGSVLVRTDDSVNPLRRWNPTTRTWTGSGGPASYFPAVGTIALAAGDKAFLFGIQWDPGVLAATTPAEETVMPHVLTEQPNAAWMWSP